MFFERKPKKEITLPVSLLLKGSTKKSVARAITKKPLSKAKKVFESSSALEIKKIRIKRNKIAKIRNLVPLAIIEEEIDSL